MEALFRHGRSHFIMGEAICPLQTVNRWSRDLCNIYLCIDNDNTKYRNIMWYVVTVAIMSCMVLRI